MISRIRFYMTFDEEWIEGIKHPRKTLMDLLEDGLETYGEVLSSFDYHDGVAIINMISSLDCESIEEHICEILLNNFSDLSESSFDIEIDLDVEIEDFDDF